MHRFIPERLHRALAGEWCMNPLAFPRCNDPLRCTRVFRSSVGCCCSAMPWLCLPIRLPLRRRTGGAWVGAACRFGPTLEPFAGLFARRFCIALPTPSSSSRTASRCRNAFVSRCRLSRVSVEPSHFASPWGASSAPAPSPVHNIIAGWRGASRKRPWFRRHHAMAVVVRPGPK